MNKNVTKLFYRSDGTLEKQINSPIHASSNYANVIEMYSENGNTNLMYISFQLPNGIVTPARPIFAIPEEQDVVVEGKTYGVYTYSIPNAITNTLGNNALKCSFREYALYTFLGFYSTVDDLPISTVDFDYIDDYYAYVVSNNLIYKNTYNPDLNDYEGWVTTGSNILKEGELVKAYGVASIPVYKTITLDTEEQDDVPTDELVLSEIATLQAQISSEVIARKNNDDTISSALTTEIANRKKADTGIVSTLTTAIDKKAEITYVDTTFAKLTDFQALQTKEDTDYTENKDKISSLQQQIKDLQSAGFTTKIVSVLPATGLSNVIYLIPKKDSEANDSYEEYLWVEYENGTYGYEHIGSTSIDLSNYYTKEQTRTYVSNVLPKKTSDLTNDSGFQTQTQVKEIVTSYGYQTADQVNQLITDYLSSITYNGESEDL